MKLEIREDRAAFAEAERRGPPRDGLKVGLGRAPAIAAVDLGASKVACFIMKPDGIRPADRTITAAGVGYVQSRGIRGGAVIDVEEAASAIAKAVERAEALAKVSVGGVTVATLTPGKMQIPVRSGGDQAVECTLTSEG